MDGPYRREAVNVFIPTVPNICCLEAEQANLESGDILMFLTNAEEAADICRKNQFLMFSFSLYNLIRTLTLLNLNRSVSG